MNNIKMISAVSQNGVIGKNNDLPWAGRYKEDMQFFRKMTAGAEVIMGRNTFQSFGSKPLPKRNNIVITREQELPGVKCFPSLQSWIRSRALILEDVAVDKWIIGGERLYRDAMQLDEVKDIYLTLIPEVVEGDNLVRFPWIDPSKFQPIEFIPLEHKIYSTETEKHNYNELKVAHYVRI